MQLRGQITVPATVRDEFNIGPGDTVDVEVVV